MTREHKLALIVGFSLFLVLGVLISDHFSKARQVEMAENIQPATGREMGGIPTGVRMASEPGVAGASGAAIPTPSQSEPRRGDLVQLPGMGTLGAPSPAPVGSTIVVNAPRVGPSVALADVGGRLPLGDSHFDATPTPPPVATPPQPQIPLQRHEVKEGDTLYRIAVKYYGDGKLWEKVRDYNKDKVGAAGLREGVTLMIPPKDVLLGKPYVPPTTSIQTSGSPSTIIMDSTRGGTPDNKPKTDAAKPAGDYREYIVKEGDTLVAISRKMLGGPKRFNEIIEANKGTLSDPEALTVGMKLRIPAK